MLPGRSRRPHEPAHTRKLRWHSPQLTRRQIRNTHIGRAGAVAMSLITLDDRTREESVARDQAYFQPYITGNVRQQSRQALGRASPSHGLHRFRQRGRTPLPANDLSPHVTANPTGSKVQERTRATWACDDLEVNRSDTASAVRIGVVVPAWSSRQVRDASVCIATTPGTRSLSFWPSERGRSLVRGIPHCSEISWRSPAGT